MSNPLLNLQDLPPFSAILPEHVEPALDELLASSRALVKKLLQQDVYSWNNLVQPLEEADDRLSRMWSPVSHMNSVVNSEALREAYNACLPKLSEYSTEMGQNEKLYQAYHSIKDSPEFASLDEAQQKIINNALRDFHLSGVDLPAVKKTRYKEIQQQLSQLTTRYEENLLDATNAWSKVIDDEALLVGIPESSMAMLKQNATQHDVEGWRLNLDFPCYHAVMTYAENRQLREEMYTAYVTRASDQGPHDRKWDNTEVMEQILALRHELAQLLGFKNYAERSLATKMADSPEHVLSFLHDLARRSRPMAEQEYNAICAFAKEYDGNDAMAAWDMAYYSEKQRQSLFDLKQQELKPYFPETKVIEGMFEVVKRLYDITIKAVDGIDRWHPDVRFYEIRDNQGELRGQFYLDLYARQHKRGGAWMDDCRGRFRLSDGRMQTPVAYLTCNLTPPVGDDPALFTHDEVITLFHEFGHGLHHMLTQVNHISVSGINGVAWDAVELPSQFMENWCWEREAIDLIAAHYQTGEAMPEDLYQRMYAAKNFQAGMIMVRQLEFSLFDFRIHAEYEPSRGARIQQILNEVRDEVAVVKPPVFNRFQHSFSHIFAGGYAAGYYSYKWAEVLSADAFSRFEETGIFNAETGAAFLHHILEMGGAREPMQLFIEFRGREPQIDALLRHNGIAA